MNTSRYRNQGDDSNIYQKRVFPRKVKGATGFMIRNSAYLISSRPTRSTRVFSRTQASSRPPTNARLLQHRRKTVSTTGNARTRLTLPRIIATATRKILCVLVPTLCLPATGLPDRRGVRPSTVSIATGFPDETRRARPQVRIIATGVADDYFAAMRSLSSG